MKNENRSSRPYHILVVDDEQALRDLLTELLLSEGYRVPATAKGASAPDVLWQQTIDLAALDLKLAGLDG